MSGGPEAPSKVSTYSTTRLNGDHFDLVFRAISEHDGVPIKTIGDEVMGVFTNDVSALNGALLGRKSVEYALQ